MRTQIIKSFLLMVLVSLLVMGCYRSAPVEADPAENSAGNAGEGAQPDVAESGDMPPAPDQDTAICDSLTPLFSGAFQAEMSTDTAPFQDVVSGQMIDGCLSTLSKSSEDFTSFEVAASLSDSVMQANGWREDINYGGDGPGGVMRGYRQNDSVCVVVTEFGPVDDALCSSDEPIGVCMDKLTADQIIYTVALSCAIVPGSSTGADNQTEGGVPEILPPPFDFGMVQSLVFTEVPPMLPTSFMVEDENALHPFVLTMETGIYEVSLDYGEECQGATACHLGVVAGAFAMGDVPVSTPNIVVDMSRAEPVMLSNGIQGYFIEGLCGASCDNSLLVWIQDGYQYIFGIKAAPQTLLLDIVNSAIANLTH